MILAYDNLNWRPNGYSYSVLSSKASIECPIAKLMDYLVWEDKLLASDNAFALFTVRHFKT